MKRELNDFDIELNGETEVFFFDNKKYDGTIFENFKNSIVNVFEVKKGLKNGVQKNYYLNNSIETVSFYENGIVEGSVKNYTEDGYLEEEAFFEKGICLSSKILNNQGNVIEEFKIDKESSDYAILEVYRKLNTK